jgi:hypothetical protein
MLLQVMGLACLFLTKFGWYGWLNDFGIAMLVGSLLFSVVSLISYGL